MVTPLALPPLTIVLTTIIDPDCYSVFSNAFGSACCAVYINCVPALCTCCVLCVQVLDATLAKINCIFICCELTNENGADNEAPATSMSRWYSISKW